MRLKKFEQRKLDLERKFAEEIKALEESEKRERDKLVEPIAAKIGKIVEDEVRRLLSAEPEIAENFSARKREVLELMAPAVKALFEPRVAGPSNDLQSESADRPKPHASGAVVSQTQ